MPLRNLRKLWSNSKQKTILEIENDCEKRADCGDAKKTSPQLPLLQVWPSQDSPEKIQSSSQHFVFNCEDLNNVHQNDSGIDSTQVKKSIIYFLLFYISFLGILSFSIILFRNSVLF